MLSMYINLKKCNLYVKNSSKEILQYNNIWKFTNLHEMKWNGMMKTLLIYDLYYKSNRWELFDVENNLIRGPIDF